MDVKNFNTIPETIPIKKIVKETDTIWTFQFEYNLESKPGQFLMLWIPGVDEKPFSIAYDDGKEFWLTIAKVGSATEELFKLKEGDLIGIRGPFGTHYKWEKGKHLVLLAGGYGAAPLYGLARAAVEDGCKVDFVVGARSEDLLLYEERVSALGSNVTYHAATDDGSKGHEGYNTEILEEIIASKDGEGVSKIYACGPEMMMKRAAEIARDKGIKSELALERYMKCGFGVCGQCCVDETGVCVCKEGTVFDGERALGFSEFGKYHRDSMGKKVEW
ncbi:dihydroorotate dehydrogenase electron transfer subunit [Candidatus Peregrinibacteria bacterium]|jgi:dihydroorotate dehydrogenase electron transfer subunit|nr:dihydroorotate dehydrogenase electron transfer subunit [Candidatus Peregrinibacteria bacterium]MBT4147894.1 dihydroorotate dehydrogenase electron transfer subunit [Candidatus Peregrinibacteria bacterium]MBT4456385.1 dihydroorotate dehydrogenase electron transfer subunit [Candidatus Peregrinibacteria bacterium]